MPKQWMSAIEAESFLEERTEGYLATADAAGRPYLTPLNYVFHNGKIYFHCKLSGRKLENIAANPQVCFGVSQTAKNLFSGKRPCACATRYTSVLISGSARIVADGAEKARLLNVLLEKFSGGQSYHPVDEEGAAACAVVEVSIDELSGKRNVDEAP
jgi:nitroimidazol reductase NimA-like FMN-containing flavoprotein (pyridoxamine 5'-phosphate oxidase superfamily)